MHKLCEYIDDELKEMEKKVASGGTLSRTEIEDGKNLAKFKMALLTNEAMERDDGESGYYPYMRGGRSYAQRRDAMGRYSRENRGYSRDDARADMIDDLKSLMHDAPDEHMKKKLQRFISEIENA